MIGQAFHLQLKYVLNKRGPLACCFDIGTALNWSATFMIVMTLFCLENEIVVGVRPRHLVFIALGLVL